MEVNGHDPRFHRLRMDTRSNSQEDDGGEEPRDGWWNIQPVKPKVSNEEKKRDNDKMEKKVNQL